MIISVYIVLLKLICCNILVTERGSPHAIIPYIIHHPSQVTLFLYTIVDTPDTALIRKRGYFGVVSMRPDEIRIYIFTDRICNKTHCCLCYNKRVNRMHKCSWKYVNMLVDDHNENGIVQ